MLKSRMELTTMGALRTQYGTAKLQLSYKDIFILLNFVYRQRSSYNYNLSLHATESVNITTELLNTQRDTRLSLSALQQRLTSALIT